MFFWLTLLIAYLASYPRALSLSTSLNRWEIASNGCEREFYLVEDVTLTPHFYIPETIQLDSLSPSGSGVECQLTTLPHLASGAYVTTSTFQFIPYLNIICLSKQDQFLYLSTLVPALPLLIKGEMNNKARGNVTSGTTLNKNNNNNKPVFTHGNNSEFP